MECARDVHLHRLLVSSENPVHLDGVADMLTARGIITTRGLHRPWRSDRFEAALMVPEHDYVRALTLYVEHGVLPGVPF